MRALYQDSEAEQLFLRVTCVYRIGTALVLLGTRRRRAPTTSLNAHVGAGGSTLVNLGRAWRAKLIRRRRLSYSRCRPLVSWDVSTETSDRHTESMQLWRLP